MNIQTEIAEGFYTTSHDQRLPWRELGEIRATPEWEVEPHTNAGDELYFQAEGESHWMVAGQSLRIPEGGCYLIPKGVSHHLVSLEGPNNHYYFTVLRPEFLASIGLGLPNQSWPDKAWLGLDVSEMHHAFRALSQEAMCHSRQQRLLWNTYHMALCYHVGRVYTEKLEQEDGADLVHPCASDARNMIDQKPGHPWTVAQLAAKAGLSTNHLIRTFRECYGQTPKQYILAKKLEYARSLITHSQRSIADIAIESGFSSSQHLATVFRKHYGMQPSHMRQ